MLKHFHLTRLQWKSILKWVLYSLFFLLMLLIQNDAAAKNPIFGVKLSLIPTVLVCVCVREGPEKGGLFALLGSVVWCFSGADYGNLSVAVVTICAVLSAVLCRAAFNDRLLPVLLCCFVTLLLNELVIFAFKLILSRIRLNNLWRVLLPGVALSVPVVLPVYPIVKAIHRTGGSHGV